jgi:hypothetical protein
VKFRLPDTNPDGGDFISGQIIRVGLFVRGQNTNQLTVTIEPSLTQISPTAGAPGAPVSLKGTALGPTPGELTIDNSKLDASSISSWSNEEIKFAIPPQHPNGTAWKAGQKISIGVTVQKKQSNKVEFTVN